VLNFVELASSVVFKESCSFHLEYDKRNGTNKTAAQNYIVLLGMWLYVTYFFQHQVIQVKAFFFV